MQEFIERPLLQAGFFILLSIVILPIVRPKDADSVWSIAGAVYGVFILVNSVLILFVPRVWFYFLYSMLFSFVYLLATAVTIPAYIKLTNTAGSNENAMVFLVAMYHPLAALLVIFLQWAYLTVFGQ